MIKLARRSYFEDIIVQLQRFIQACSDLDSIQYSEHSPHLLYGQDSGSIYVTETNVKIDGSQSTTRWTFATGDAESLYTCLTGKCSIVMKALRGCSPYASCYFRLERLTLKIDTHVMQSNISECFVKFMNSRGAGIGKVCQVYCGLYND